MFKVIAAAWLVFASIHYSQVVPDRADMTPVSVPQRLLKGDRLPVQPVCGKGASWPCYDATCMRDRTQPAEQPPQNREIRIVAIDRLPGKLAAASVAN